MLSRIITSKSLAIIFLLFVVFLLPFLATQNFSPVVDEVTHLSSGYSYLRTGEIKLNLQHPPLIKMLAALPLLFLDLKFEPNDLKLIDSQAKEWQFGRDFLFKNGVDRVIFWGRIPMLLLSVLLGGYIYKWGKELFGYRAGLIGLFIYTFMPNIIAHSQLVTTDLGLATFSFIAMYYLWKLLKSDFNRRYLICSGLFLGLALGSKFSAMFLLPVFFILLFIYIYRTHRNSSWLFKIIFFLKVSTPLYGLAFLVVWGLYFFTSDLLFYWKGLNTIYADSNIGYPYYLNGDFKPGGWWYYFLWAFIIKTPVPFLILLLVTFFTYKKIGLRLLQSSFIFLPVLLFLFVASWKAHNIGVRYILVVYPFLILFVGRQVIAIVENLKLKVKNYSFKLKIFKLKPSLLTLYFLLLILFGWYVFSSVNVYPDYLSYFNELVGGSNNGYKYLDDSNIDWGQDLKRLVRYQEKNPDLQVVYVWDSYVDAARLYGIKNILSPNSQELWLNPKGKYAVSTHAVIRTKLVGQVTENDKMNWVDRYKPIDRIGQSFFIYEF